MTHEMQSVFTTLLSRAHYSESSIRHMKTRLNNEIRRQYVLEDEVRQYRVLRAKIGNIARQLGWDETKDKTAIDYLLEEL